MASELATIGRPPNHNPALATTNDDSGLTPASPGAAVNNGRGPSLSWTGGFDPARTLKRACRLPAIVKVEMNNDPTVAQCKSIFRGLVQDSDPRLISAYSRRVFETDDATGALKPDPKQADYDAAQMALDFVHYCYVNVDGGMWQHDHTMLEAAFEGLTVGVIVCKQEKYSGDSKNQVKWTLDYIQHLHEHEYVPYFENRRLIGFQVFGNVDDAGMPVIWGLDKFAVCTFRPTGGDIWGNDLDTAAWLPWVLNNKGWEQYYAAMEQVGTPTAVHTAPKDMHGKVVLEDGDGFELYWQDAGHTKRGILATTYGKVMVSPQFAQQFAMQNGLHSGGTVGLAGGAEAKYLEAQNSQSLPSFVEDTVIAMHRAYLGTPKYAERGTHESSGSSQAGERIASFTAAAGKAMLESARDQISRSLIKWNYGANMVHYRPRTDFGSGLSSQIAQLINSLAALISVNGATQHQVQDVLVNQCGFPQAQAAELAAMAKLRAANPTQTGNAPNDVADTGKKPMPT